MLWISLWYNTLSNAPNISRHSIDTTIVGSVFYIVQTCSIISLRAKIVDLSGLAPIWDQGRRFLPSASLLILFVTIASRTFANVLSSTIGRYAPGLVQSGFCGFLRTTVIKCFRGLGQYPYLRYTIKNQYSTGPSSSLYSLSRRLGIWSGPGALLIGIFPRTLYSSPGSTSSSIKNSSGYIASQISYRFAGFGSGKKYYIRASTLPWFLAYITPSLFLISRNQGRGVLWPALSLAYFTSFQIFFGSSVISLTVALYSRFLSFLIYFPLVYNTTKQATRLSSILSWLYSLFRYLV